MRTLYCPECKANGQRSTFAPVSSTTAIAGIRRFIDEAGDEHYHNPNPIIVKYACSEGHEWIKKMTPKCSSCSYGHEEETVYEQAN